MTLESKNGLSGLVNNGNSCYINSVIQSLSHTELLTKYFLSDDYKENLNKKSIEYQFTYQWYRVLNALWEENCTISPISFIKSLIEISNKKNIELNFSNFYQNDFQEFLVFFLDTLHNSLKYSINIEIKGKIKNKLDKIAIEAAKSWISFFKNDYSKIIEIFYGQLVTEIIDNNTNRTISRSFQPFCFLILPITSKNKDNLNIYSCLDLYFKSEKLNTSFKTDDKNIYNNVSKKISIWELPNILIICLNRFDNHNNKINFLVECQYEINVKKYSFFEGGTYELYSVCNHYGFTNGGHYTSICKNNNQWYEFNDEKVIKIDKKNVITQNAYCLFYKKI